MDSKECRLSTRLVDYVAIVVPRDPNEPSSSQGHVLTRLPTTDWPDVHFVPGLETFCEPAGWRTYTRPFRPRLHATVLTDAVGEQHQCVVLTLPQPVAPLPPTPHRHQSESRESLNSECNGETSTESGYEPLCIVAVSKHPLVNALKHIVRCIYLAYHQDRQDNDSDGVASMVEAMCASILAKLALPPQLGADSLEYNLYHNERLKLSTPQQRTLPTTGITVATLYNSLGCIHSLTSLVCAMLTDKKVLFHSLSYSRLTECCSALLALMYPLKYSCVFVPILPPNALSILECTLPFVMGVHSSLQSSAQDILDSLSPAEENEYVIVDLNTGKVQLSAHCRIPQLPEPYHTKLVQRLLRICNASALTADRAFSAEEPSSLPLPRLDKMLRATFLRLMVELFAGYRAFLQVVRVLPEPVVSLHRAAFLAYKKLDDDSFVKSLFDSQALSQMMHERGLPFRALDLFDTAIANYGLSTEVQIRQQSPLVALASVEQQLNIVRYEDVQWEQALMQPVHTLADEIAQLEPYVVTSSSTEAPIELQSTPPPFPRIDAANVQRMIEALLKERKQEEMFVQEEARAVIAGDTRLRVQPAPPMRAHKERRLSVLSSCLQAIFENRVAEARKMISAVLASLKSCDVRIALCRELDEYRTQRSRNVLEPAQFDILVRLMNAALEQENETDANGIAYTMLEMAHIYCRRLTAGVHQFAYTCIQDHKVWSSTQFWQSAFYQDIHRQLRRLYRPELANRNNDHSLTQHDDLWAFAEQPSMTQIAADVLQEIHTHSPESRENRVEEEQSVLYSQLQHCINRMISMRTPLDPSRLRHVNIDELERRSEEMAQIERQRRVEMERKRMQMASMHPSDNNEPVVPSAGVSIELTAPSTGKDIASQTIRFISRFLNKVVNDINLNADFIYKLNSNLPGHVAMHVEHLEQVHRESRRLPNPLKGNIDPALASGEKIIMGPIRVFLLPDGRDETFIRVANYERTMALSVTHAVEYTGETPTHAVAPHEEVWPLLPAEGALFLTNYRLIFKGLPCDPLVCEQVVVRAMPIMSIMNVTNKECHPAITKLMHRAISLSSASSDSAIDFDVVEFNSATFQMMHIATNDDISNEQVSALRQRLNDMRYVAEPRQLFAYHQPGDAATLTADVRAMTIASSKAISIAPTKSKTVGGRARQTLNRAVNAATLAKLPKNAVPKAQSGVTIDGQKIPSNATNGEISLIERDFVRLHISEHTKLRYTDANREYAFCKSYPSLLVVPTCLSDAQLSKAARGHRHGHLPHVVWHSTRGALLLRGAAFEFKTAADRVLKLTGKAIQRGRDVLEAVPHELAETHGMKTSEEQERYFTALVDASPLGSKAMPANINARTDDDNISVRSDETILSFDSAYFPSGSYMDDTQSINTAQSSLDAQSFLRAHHLSASTVRRSLARRMHMSTRGPKDELSVKSATRPRLYILGETHQSRSVKLPAHVEFVPIDFPSSHDVKESFRTLFETVTPSAPTLIDNVITDNPCRGYWRHLDNTKWLHHVASLLRVAGVIADIVTTQNSSVAVCIENGNDATCAIVSLAEIFLDAHYRTRDGFAVLIEREWLAAGHRFSHRLNHTIASVQSGVCPMFLLFLDAVYQIFAQNVWAFEFNEYYLRFLAYHSMSAFTTDFLLDSEAERRVWAAKLHNDAQQSIWTLIEEYNRSGGRQHFDNDCYAPALRDDDRSVLNISPHELHLWSYYVDDPLATGPPYDVVCYERECGERELAAATGVDAAEMGQAAMARVLVNQDYDSAMYDMSALSGIRHLLQELERCEIDMGSAASVGWMSQAHEYARAHLINDECANSGGTHSFVCDLSRNYTVELLLRGRRVQQVLADVGAQVARSSDTGRSSTQGAGEHRLTEYNFSAPEICRLCNQVIWGVALSGLKCENCKSFNVHDRCLARAGTAPHTCTASDANTLRPTSRLIEDKRQTIVERERLSKDDVHISAGYLEKKDRHGVLRQWRMRYFVLDARAYQLYYYESENDIKRKNIIELASITHISPRPYASPGEPKGEACCFEIRTTSGIYDLRASTQREAERWISRIDSCLDS